MRPVCVFGALILTVCVLAGIDLCTGSAPLSIADVVATLVGNDRGAAPHAEVVRLIRGPRVLTAMLAGASLAIAGLLLQTLFRNPLAGPYVVGISAGASLGAACVLLVGGAWLASFGSASWLGATSLTAASGVGAMAITAIMVAISRRIRQGVTLLIIGLMMGYLVSAVVSTMMLMSSAQEVQRFAFWGMGSFSDTTGPSLIILMVSLAVGGLGAWMMSKRLDVLLMGEAYASTMGVPVKSVRSLVLCFSSILAASVTACCGPIAFLGLASPHAARKLLHHHSHQLLLPCSALVGMGVALLADIVTQWSSDGYRLPLNAVLSLVGAPVVILLIVRRQGRS